MIKTIFCVALLLTLLAGCAYSEEGLAGDKKLCEGYCAGKQMNCEGNYLKNGTQTCYCSKTISTINNGGIY